MRIAPRKARLVADLVRRSKDMDDAIYNLKYSTKRASTPILKLLNSAMANAKQKDASLTEDKMEIKEIRVDEGVKLKRFRAGSRGIAKPINKKTSHIHIVIAEKEKPASAQKKSKSATATPKQETKKETPAPEEKSDVAKEPQKSKTQTATASKEEKPAKAEDRKDATSKDENKS